jgi:ACS family pantothenate transporter-like MFS transporter
MSTLTFFGFFANLCLAIWAIPNGLKWFSYFISKAAVPYGLLSMSWADEICGEDAEEQGLSWELRMHRATLSMLGCHC